MGWTRMYYISIFISLKTYYCNLCILYKYTAYSASEKMEEIVESKQFSRKTTISSTFIIRQMFKGYCGESDKLLFNWYITWNYKYGPFILFESRKWKWKSGSGKWKMEIWKWKMFVFSFPDISINAFLLHCVSTHNCVNIRSTKILTRAQCSAKK